jgi:hypothetical protein
MQVTRKCIITNTYNTLDINITEEELIRIENRNITGEYIQNIVPHLALSEREFLMTGILNTTWNKYLTENLETVIG